MPARREPAERLKFPAGRKEREASEPAGELARTRRAVIALYRFASTNSPVSFIRLRVKVQRTKLVGKAADIVVEVVTRNPSLPMPLSSTLALPLRRVTASASARLGCSFYDFTERLLRVVVPSSIFLLPRHPPFVFVVNVPRSSASPSRPRAIQNLDASAPRERWAFYLFIPAPLWTFYLESRNAVDRRPCAQRTRPYLYDSIL